MAVVEPNQRQRVGSVLFANWTITVTNPANAAASTSVMDVRAYKGKLFKFNNGTNQTVSITIRAVDDVAGTDPRAVGSTLTILAAGTDEVYITDYYHYLEVRYDPAADATGDLVIKLQAVQEGTA